MLLSDLHKIGPSDTPISSSSSFLNPPPLLVQAGLAWLAGELRRGTACKLPGTGPALPQALEVPEYSGTSVPSQEPRRQCALARAGPAWPKCDSADHSQSTARRSPGLGTTLPDLFFDGNLA